MTAPSTVRLAASLPGTALLRIAFRNVRRQLRHSAFALAAIAFGVAGLALADGFIRDVFFQLGEATARAELGHIQISRPGFRNGGAGRPEEYVIERPESIRALLAGDPRVESVGGRLEASGLLSAGGREFPVLIEGIEPVPVSSTGTYLQLLAGRDLTAAGPGAGLLGEGLAGRLRLAPGGDAILMASTIDGAMNSTDLRVAGVFRSFSKDYDDRSLRVPLGDVQDLLQIGGVNALVVHLHQTDQTDSVLEGLRARPEAAGLEIAPWYELSDFYRGTRALYARQFGILQGIALVLIAMSVLTSFNITVFERTAEFGTMRALGAHSGRVVQLVVVEGAILGALGAAMGMVFAVVAGVLISRIGIPMPPPPNAESGFIARILLDGGALWAAAGVGLVSALLGSLLPSFRAARMPIVEALGRRI